MIDEAFWTGERWDGHRAFETVTHLQVACYRPAGERAQCDLMVIGCADGRWYVEDTWAGDAEGQGGVWNAHDPVAQEPRFFPSKEAALALAISVVASLCGVPESAVTVT